MTYSQNRRFFVRFLCTSTTVLALLSMGNADDWLRFRGPNGTGRGEAPGLPTQWTEDDYAWRVEIPGIGHAAPIISGNRLFVTSATEEGRLRHLYCLNAETGEEIWCQSLAMNTNRKHDKNSFASSTPTTDGQYVYAAFADSERFYLSAYDFDGSLIWRRRFQGYGSSHGLGASPIVVGDLLIMTGDQEGPSWLRALDKKTGDTVWSVSREFRRTSYATPLVLETGDSPPQLICLSGANGLTSLDPETGRLNWQTGMLPSRTVGSPIVSRGLVIATCGGGGVGKQLIAVDPSLTLSDEANRIKYTRDSKLPYVPTIIADGDYYFLWNDNGVVSCVESDSGQNVWTKRVGGNYSSSPVLVGGKIYCIAEDGNVAVIDAAPEYQLFGKNPLGDKSHSTPAVAGGRLYLRGFHTLACLESRQ